VRKIVAFYAWQSDTLTKINKDFIRKALDLAAERINSDSSLAVELKIDSDTQNVPGTPPITATILEKIALCDIFIPDVTFVAATTGGKLVPNPNVMAEYGYALRAKTDRAMMPIMNIAFGPPEELPFDMGHLRHPIQYRVETTVSDGQRRADRLALSQRIEIHLRQQIVATQPPPPAPAPFASAESRDGPARFRAAGEPIGKRWNDIPMPRAPRQTVFLADGPAMWLRLMPIDDPGRKWPIETLKNSAIPAGKFNLEPFHTAPGDSIFLLGADDGMGICGLEMPASTETRSVAYAFRTGEVWSVDTAVLSYHPGILVGDIEKLYRDRLVGYAQFLLSLGLQPPFRWIAGIADIKGRHLQIPLSPSAAQPFFLGPECLSTNIGAEGTYDGKGESGVALLGFFVAIYEECGRKRPT
jgi:hypothetical protein